MYRMQPYPLTKTVETLLLQWGVGGGREYDRDHVAFKARNISVPLQKNLANFCTSTKIVCQMRLREYGISGFSFQAVILSLNGRGLILSTVLCQYMLPIFLCILQNVSVREIFLTSTLCK